MKRHLKYILLPAALLCLVCGCVKESIKEVYLSVENDCFSVTKKGVTFNGEKISIHVSSNTYWAAELEPDCKWLQLDIMGASGDATINVSVKENDSEARSAVITFTSLNAGDCKVTVSQASASETVYYMKDSFSNAPDGELSEENGIYEIEGIGKDNVSCSGAGVTFSSSDPSGQYEGASGGKNAAIEEGGSLVFGPVTVKSANNFIISFGAKAAAAGELSLSISKTKKYWGEVAALTDISGDWRYYRTPFLIADGNESFYIKLEAVSGEFRIDDISLDEGDESGETVIFPEDNISYVHYPVYEEYFEWLSPSSGATAAMPGSDGGNISNEPDMHGLEASYVYRRPGFVKCGTANEAASITTPKLAVLGTESKDIWVNFDAAGYSTDDDAIVIAVKGSGLIALNNESSYTFNLRSSNRWANFQFEVLNASANTQITFKCSKSTAEIKSTSMPNRFFLDNIVISYREEVGVETKPEISCDRESVDIPVGGDAQKLVLNSNYSWEAEASEKWIHVDPVSGDAGSSSISISADRNSSEDRSGFVTFTTKSGKEDVSVKVEVNQKFIKPSLPAPDVTVQYTYWNALSFKWNRMDNEYSSHKFVFGLYDAAGNIISKEWTQTFNNSAYPFCAITYSGLEMSSEYTFRIKAVSNNEAVCDDSEILEVKAATNGRSIETGVVLAEHFDNLVWGGDYMNGAYGLRAESKEKTMTSNDLSQADKIVTPGTSTGDLFNTGSFPEAYRNNAAGLDGWSGSKLYVMNCVAKFGTGSAIGWIQTPKLAKITGTKDIEVTFNTCIYQDYGEGKSPDHDLIELSASGSGVPEQTSIKMNSTFSMEEHKVIVRGATSETRIKFSAVKAASNRFFLDDIVIREIGDSETSDDKVKAPAGVQLLVAHRTDLAFKWSEPEDNTARKYKVYLYKDPAKDPLYSYTVTYGNKFHQAAFTFAGLDYGTDYYMGVQSVSSDAAKSDSEIVIIGGKTLAKKSLPAGTVFFEGFDKCCWGGDHVYYTSGARPTNSDMNATAETWPDKVATSNDGGSANMFTANNQTAYLVQRGLSGWSTGTACYEFPGYFKFGSASAAGTVSTPYFTELGDTPADIIFSFNASPWVEPTANEPDNNVSDTATAILKVEGPGQIVYNGKETDSAEINVGAMPQREWSSVSIEILGATKDTRVKFNSKNTNSGAASKCRWCVDEILVTRK